MNESEWEGRIMSAKVVPGRDAYTVRLNTHNICFAVKLIYFGACRNLQQLLQIKVPNPNQNRHSSPLNLLTLSRKLQM